MAKDYMYTVGDGFVNPLGWSIAHIACKYGDVMVLELTQGQDLRRNSMKDFVGMECLMEQWKFSWKLWRFQYISTRSLNFSNANGHHSNSRSCFTLSWGLHARDVYCWRIESAQFHGRSSSTLCREQLSNERGICVNHVAATKWSMSFCLSETLGFQMFMFDIDNSLQRGFFINFISVL